MNIINSVQIDNLWGSFSVSFKCDSKFNFLIGQNGAGKTTVINLITAVLTGDFEKLDKTEFDRIIITFKPNTGRSKPSIEVKKTKKENVPFYEISYEFRQSQKGDDSIKFNFGEIDQEMFFRRGMLPSSLREKRIADSSDIRKQLKFFVNVCWLSVNRLNEEIRISDERKIIPAVDQKLMSLSNSLVRYFSMLAKKYQNDIIELQKKTLLSVLTPEESRDVITSTKLIDVEREKESLAGMFKVLGVDEKKYAPKIRSHFEKFNKANKDKDKNGLTVEQFATIYDTWRSHNLVQGYEELQQREVNIFKSRDNFVAVVNELFNGRKKMSLSEQNELCFKTKSGRQISIEALSSGEKQLLIILGEALLQQEEPVVYIADEPELSLHISWQETLTSSISRLNPNAQILFATHSPDIVSIHSDKVINMEDIIK